MLNRRLFFGAVLALASLSFPVAAEASTLLVANRGTHSIMQFDATTGAYLGDLIGFSNPLSISLDPTEQLILPSAMVLGANNDLFVASHYGNTILRYDRTTGEFLGKVADVPEGPSGLYYDSMSNTLFASTLYLDPDFGGFDSNVIYAFDATTGAPRTGGNFDANGAFGLDTPETGRADLTIGPDGKLYVAGFYDGVVRVFDPATGASEGNFATTGPYGANGIVFGDDGSLYVVNMFASSVSEISSDGTTVTDFISNSDGVFFPSDILLLDNGTFLVSNMGNDRSNDPNFPGVPVENGYISHHAANGDLLGVFAISPFPFDADDPATIWFQPTAMLLLPATTAIPEPSAWALLLVGAAGVISLIRRRLA